MSETLYFAILAIIQGITEFLPISSSAHLILAPHIFGMPDQGYEIDIAVHFGSLFAVMLYFRSEVARLVIGGIDFLRIRRSDNRTLFLNLVIATVPVVVVGAALEATGLLDSLRNPTIIAYAMIGFGLLLYFIDRNANSTKTFDDWNTRDAVVMGLWQAVALIPGTSRSGATITGSRQLGFNRPDGAKISMLMSIPTIIAGATILALKIATADEPSALGLNAAIAALFAFVAAYFALSLMMRLLRTVSYAPYVVYRVIFGIVLLAVFGFTP